MLFPPVNRSYKLTTKQSVYYRISLCVAGKIVACAKSCAGNRRITNSAIIADSFYEPRYLPHVHFANTYFRKAVNICASSFFPRGIAEVRI